MKIRRRVGFWGLTRPARTTGRCDQVREPADPMEETLPVKDKKEENKE